MATRTGTSKGKLRQHGARAAFLTPRLREHICVRTPGAVDTSGPRDCTGARLSPRVHAGASWQRRACATGLPAQRHTQSMFWHMGGRV